MEYPRCDRLTRREALRVGGLTAFGLGLGTLARWQSATAAQGIQRTPTTGSRPATAKSCILIWLDGGPSHLETFDPKPDAPREVRGPLGSVPTSIAGIHLSECLPQVAKRMKEFAIIRSMTSPLGEHSFGAHYLQTGFRPTPSLEYPSFHAVGASVFDNVSQLPPNIAIPNFAVGGSQFRGHGFLDQSVAPFPIGSDPANADFGVRDLNLYQGLTLERLKRRDAFVRKLDQLGRLELETGDVAFEQAFQMVTSPSAKKAFRIEDETPATRQRYGMRSVGQSCLLARRLVERGVPFVTVNHKGWDTHADLKTRIKDGFSGARSPVGLVPSLDLAVAALVDDLKDRRMLEDTLVLVMGEFGRTPKLNAAGGRDHWPRVFSVLLAGGGVAGGQVIGASDRVGESPIERPVTPGDLVASIYALLGIDPKLELRTSEGRPIRITPADAQVVTELLAAKR